MAALPARAFTPALKDGALARTPVAHYLGGELDDAGRAAMLEIVEAARRMHEANDTPERRERQAESIRRIRERNARMRGNQMSTAIEPARWYPDMPPALDGETDEQYTNRLTGADKTGRYPYDHQRNRQCSIGYHRECSDPDGESCECPCHREESEPLTVEEYAVGLVADGAESTAEDDLMLPHA